MSESPNGGARPFALLFRESPKSNRPPWDSYLRRCRRRELRASPSILAAVVIEPGLLASEGYCSTALTEKTDTVRGGAIFSATPYIYGIELLSVAATVSRLRDYKR